MPDDAYLRRTYGITKLQWQELYTLQGGTCALEGCSRSEGLCVDHDHVTLEVRGLLCDYHNYRLIGRWRDPEIFRAAAAYLENPPGRIVLGAEHRVPKRKRRR
jgi:hypothetical protein